MTDLETQVEALLKTLSFKRYEPDGGLFDEDQVRALVASLVQEKADLQVEYKLFVDEVVAAELMIDKALDISGPVLCQNVELLIDAKEAAEARLAAVEQDRDSLIAVVTPFVDLCDNCGGKGQIGLELSCDWCSPVREVLAALTPSRMDPP